MLADVSACWSIIRLAALRFHVRDDGPSMMNVRGFAADVVSLDNVDLYCDYIRNAIFYARVMQGNGISFDDCMSRPPMKCELYF